MFKLQSARVWFLLIKNAVLISLKELPWLTTRWHFWFIFSGTGWRLSPHSPILATDVGKILGYFCISRWSLLADEQEGVIKVFTNAYGDMTEWQKKKTCTELCRWQSWNRNWFFFLPLIGNATILECLGLSSTIMLTLGKEVYFYTWEWHSYTKENHGWWGRYAARRKRSHLLQNLYGQFTIHNFKRKIFLFLFRLGKKKAMSWNVT